MLSKTFSKVALTAVLLAVPALAAPDATCDGNTTPDWDDCATIAEQYNGATGSFYKGNDDCMDLPVPPNTDPDSLNCVIQLCFNNGATSASKFGVYDDYDAVRAFCDTDRQMSAEGPLGGSTTDNSESVTVNVNLNPQYNPPSSASKVKRTHSRQLLSKRDGGVCTDGNGNYNIIVKNENVEKPGTEKAVTGRLSAGSSYMVVESDSYSVDITESVSVEAGFFDLFSASAGISVDEGYSKMTSYGVTVNVDCATGQQGIVYAYPTFTEYDGECTTDNNREIDVFVPADGQTNYRVTCLGDASD